MVFQMHAGHLMISFDGYRPSCRTYKKHARRGRLQPLPANLGRRSAAYRSRQGAPRHDEGENRILLSLGRNPLLLLIWRSCGDLCALPDSSA